jgi:hypothetical protein
MYTRLGHWAGHKSHDMPLKCWNLHSSSNSQINIQKGTIALINAMFQRAEPLKRKVSFYHLYPMHWLSYAKKSIFNRQ